MTDYIGVFSWKFPMKTQLNKDQVWWLIKDEDVDVISFVPHISNYLAWTEHQHPGFLPLFTSLCKQLGLKIKEPECVIYSNFFVAKRPVYIRYVDEILIPSIEWMERPDIKPLVIQDAKYKSGLNHTDLKKYTGLDHYPFTTFLLERLISVVIDNWNLTWKTKRLIQ